MSLPKLSVITAVLNCEKYIERAIKSVLAQNYPNLEYIIIDGGSKDNTLNIINKYRDKIAYFVSEPDKGNSDAQNKGVKAATGEYIAYLAGDDWYEDGIFNEVGKIIEQHRDAEVVTFGGRSVTLNKNGELITLNSYLGNNLNLTLKSVLATVLSNARFFRKDIFEKFGYPRHINYRGQYFLVNDREFMIRLALNKVKNYKIDRVGVNFFGHSESLTFSKNENRAYQIFQEYLDIYEDYLSRKNLSLKQRHLLRKYHRKESLRSVWRDIKNKQFSRAFETAKRGIKVNHLIWLGRFALMPIHRMMKDIAKKLGINNE